MPEQNPYTPPTVALNDDLYDQPANADYGWDVAKAQKALLLAVLLEFAGMTPRFGPILYLIGVGLSFWAVYNMGEALQTHKDGFSTGGGSKWLLLLWIPYIGFIMLFVLNHKATQFLKQAGYSVGLFGARRRRPD